MPSYFFKFKFKLENKPTPTRLMDIIDSAEERIYKKLLDLVGRRFITFSVESNAHIENDNLIVELQINLQLSPLIKDFKNQDQIARALADEFSREIHKKLAGT